MADLLCTIAQVKARAGITDTTDDAMLTEMVTELSGWIESYTGRRLAPDDAATYRFDTQDGYVLRIPYGIRSVTAMSIANQHVPDSGGSYLVSGLSSVDFAANFLLRPKAQDAPIGWPYTRIQWSRGTLTAAVSPLTRFGRYDNGVSITGNFGFASTPPDIESVCIDAVVTAYTTRGDGASGVIGADAFAGPPWSQYFSKGSPQRGTLDRYVVSAF